MRAHIIENAKIINTIEVDSLDFIPGLVAAVGEEGIGWGYDGEVFHEPPAPRQVFTAISPRQIRQALTAAGLRNAVEAAIAAGSQDLKDWWEFSTTFEREHPLVSAMATQLGVTAGQLDALWIDAAAR